MISKFNKLVRNRIIVGMLLIATVSSTAYAPIFAPRAQAIFGIGDIVIDVKALIRSVVDGIAMRLAQRMVDQMVRSTIKWANTGFEGGPAYVTDTEEYFGRIVADDIAEKIESSAFGYMCSPFQAQVKLALIKQYVEDDTRYQCTLDEIGVNIENFYNNFSEGGWEAWFKITQEDQNNPQGAFLRAQADIDEGLDRHIKLKEQELTIGSGFLSLRKCEQRNVYPPLDIERQYRNEPQSNWPSPWNDPNYYNKSKSEGECLVEGPVVTPAATIKSGLDSVLPSGMEKLISVEHVEQLIGAFASGILTRYVFGSGGLIGDNFADHFSASSNSSIGANGGYGWKFCAKLDNFCAFSGTEFVRMSWWEIERGSGLTLEQIKAVPANARRFLKIQEKSSEEKSFTGGVMCDRDSFGVGALIPQDSSVEVPTETVQCEYLGLLPPPPPTGTTQFGADYLACSPETDETTVDERALWIITTTYPVANTYGWTGDEVPDTSLDNRSTDKFKEMFYEFSGSKSMQVTVFDPAGSPLRAVDCSGDILVSPKT